MISGMPSTLSDYFKVKVEYATLKGWQSDISKVKKYSDLPQDCKNYVEFIEKAIGVPVTWIGNGPEREAMILKH